MISIIAAIGKNQEIGKQNGLLWHISEELKHFKKVTLGHPLVMGRKTYQSIGRPLPGRTSIVVSRQTGLASPKAVLVTDSLTKGLELARKQAGGEEIFIIGGASIFAQGLPLADKLYLTKVKAEFPDADAFFPGYPEFTKVRSRRLLQTANYTLEFLELVR